MNRRAIIFFAMLALFVFASFGCAVAQDPDDIQQGIKAYGTYRGGDIDSVSMTNGNLTAHIPLISYPQRGKLHLSYSLIYTRPNFSYTTRCNLNGCYYKYNFTTSPFASTSSPVAPVVDQGFTIFATPFACNGPATCTYSVVATDGASHQLGGISSTDY